MTVRREGRDGNSLKETPVVVLSVPHSPFPFGSSRSSVPLGNERSVASEMREKGTEGTVRVDLRV